MQAGQPPEAKVKYFAVGDGVNKPGIFPLLSGTDISIMEALKMAGGAWDGDFVNTPVANLKNIRVLRMIDGKQHDIKIDVSGKGVDREFRVLAGDIIMVPYYF